MVTIPGTKIADFQTMEANRVARITQKIASAASAKAARYDLWDGELPGFALRVETSGTKSFIIRYRADGGGRTAPRRLMTLGRYGVLTVDEARKEAKKLLGGVARGDDPAGDRQAKRREMTLEGLVEIYATEGAGHLRERTKRYTVARLRNHVIPLLGARRLSDIRIADIERFMHDVASGKTKRDEKVSPGKRVVVRGGAGAAAKVVRDLSALFTFAVRRELLSSNPCSKVHKPADKRRYRFLDAVEMGRLGSALNALAEEGANPKAVAIIKLLLLTGCRRNEIAGLKWSEIDFERQCLVLDETKTGRSVRPIGAAALALLSGIPRDQISPFVFPAEWGPGHYQGTRKLWPLLTQRAKLPGITNHTLRHSFGSAAASSGESLLMVGALLGHANYRSTAIYAHLQSSSQKASADRLSAAISESLQK